MGLCQYVYLCFHALSLPCLHTCWHAIPTSFYIFSSLVIITSRPHGQVIFQGTGNKNIIYISHGLITYGFMCMFSLRKSNRPNLNPTTARPLATAMQCGKAPCQTHACTPCGPLHESGRFVRTPDPPSDRA